MSNLKKLRELKEEIINLENMAHNVYENNLKVDEQVRTKKGKGNK